MLRPLKLGGVVMIGLFVAIQLVPYGRTLPNPSIHAEPQWNSARTRQLAKVACFDCHSNQTRKPIWAEVAPSSWLVQHDVEDGRHAMNFDLVGHGGGGRTDHAADAVENGEMPPRKYTLLHPDAKLSAKEKADLVAGFEATFGSDHHGGGRGGDSD